MTKISLAVVSAALAVGMAAPVVAGVNDPEVIIYRFPGVTDNGGGFELGIATAFHCTNFSGATENIRFATRRSDGGLVSNAVFPIAHLATLSVSTHNTGAYVEPMVLNTNMVTQGTTAIAATSINVICTAMTIDASALVPIGVALRGIRFSPVPGSQE